MPGLSKELQDLRISKINKKEDISGRELKEIQNDFSIFKTHPNGEEKDFGMHRMNSNRTGVSNLMSSRSQFLISERNRLLRKTTSSTSKVSGFNFSQGNKAKEKLFSPNFSQKQMQMKEMLDSKLKAKIVKSNIEKNIDKHKSNKEILQDQLVKNELISREVSKSPNPQFKTETFGLGDSDKSRDPRTKDNLRKLPIKTGKRRRPKQKRRERKRETGERGASDAEDKRGHSGTETESNSESIRREISESTQQSQSSQQTTKMLELKYQNQKRKFEKKKYTFQEIIQNQETNKRQIHQKQNSLSILGFKTKQNSVDMLIREKQEKRGRETGKREEEGSLARVEINEMDEFDTEKTRVSQVNRENYNALMSKLKKSSKQNTFRRRKSRKRVTPEKKGKHRSAISINSNKNSQKKLDTIKKPKTKGPKSRLDLAKLEPKANQIKYKTGRKNRIEKMVNNLMKRQDWIDTHFEKVDPGGVTPKKGRKTSKKRKKRSKSTKNNKPKKRKFMNSVAPKKNKRISQTITSDGEY